jgi:hypothetical protein
VVFCCPDLQNTCNTLKKKQRNSISKQAGWYGGYQQILKNIFALNNWLLQDDLPDGELERASR